MSRDRLISVTLFKSLKIVIPFSGNFFLHYKSSILSFTEKFPDAYFLGNSYHIANIPGALKKPRSKTEGGSNQVTKFPHCAPDTRLINKYHSVVRILKPRITKMWCQISSGPAPKSPTLLFITSPYRRKIASFIDSIQ